MVTIKQTALALATLLAMVVPNVGAFADNHDAAARGAALLQPFKRDLKQALMSGLQEGPDAAISVCKLEAPAIASRLSSETVTMGRTSHRLRNPANAGPAWAEAVLQEYLVNDANAGPQVRQLDDGRTGYVEPIRMQAMCLTCHGAALTPDLAATIDSEYPEDQATGFNVGDLRGVFWVAFETAEGERRSKHADPHHREPRHHRN